MVVIVLAMIMMTLKMVTARLKDNKDATGREELEMEAQLLRKVSNWVSLTALYLSLLTW